MNIMDRNLALELVRVTEAAALVSSKFMGRGDKNGADGAAVEAMRKAFESVNISGEVVIVIKQDFYQRVTLCGRNRKRNKIYKALVFVPDKFDNAFAVL